jgi:multidrug efflux pump subunit AcrA (membrane-fusion protein)
MNQATKKRISFAQLFWLGVTGALLIASIGLGVSAGLRRGPVTEIEAAPRAAATLDLADYRLDERRIALSGTVEPLDQVDLRSQLSGLVSRVAVELGDRVQAGQALAYIEAADIAVQIEAAEAAVAAQRARLAEMQKGTRAEQMEVKRVELRSAESSLAQAYRQAGLLLGDIHVRLDDLTRKQTEPLFENDTAASPTLAFETLNSQAQVNAVYERAHVNDLLAAWGEDLAALSVADYAAVDRQLASATLRIRQFEPLFDALAAALNQTNNTPDATVGALNQIVVAARQQLSGLPSQLTSQQSAIENIRLNIERVEKEISLMEAGATAEQLAAQAAGVAQAEAGLRSAQVAYGKSVIRAPLGGKVLEVPVSRGDLVSPGQVVVRLVSDLGLEVKAFVASADLDLITLGAPVSVADGASGVVARVAPALDARTGKAEIAVAVTDLGASRLLAGQNVSVSLAGSAPADADAPQWHLPLEAVRMTADGGAEVMAVGADGRAVAVPVVLGDVSGELVAVTGGLAAYGRIAALAGEVEAGDAVIVE